MRISPVRTILYAGALASLFSGTAWAQFGTPGITLAPDQKRTLTPEEAEKQKALDEKYKATMKQIPDKRAPADPWSNMRGSSSDASRQR